MKKTTIVFCVVAVIVIVVAGGIWAYKLKNNNAGIACTMEAKICPDGSAVGRTGANCEFAQCPQSTSTSTVPAKTLTYLISKETESKYCNGDNMDSEGYRKTITTEIITDTPIDTMTRSELAKATVIAATTGQCQNVLKQIGLRVEGDTASIAPIDGWAGISIVMCSCKPQIEVNLLRLPGITKVVFFTVK